MRAIWEKGCVRINKSPGDETSSNVPLQGDLALTCGDGERGGVLRDEGMRDGCIEPGARAAVQRQVGRTFDTSKGCGIFYSSQDRRGQTWAGRSIELSPSLPPSFLHRSSITTRYHRWSYRTTASWDPIIPGRAFRALGQRPIETPTSEPSQSAANIVRAPQSALPYCTSRSSLSAEKTVECSITMDPIMTR